MFFRNYDEVKRLIESVFLLTQIVSLEVLGV